MTKRSGNTQARKRSNAPSNNPSYRSFTIQGKVEASSGQLQAAKASPSGMEIFYVVAVLFLSTSPFTAFWSDPSGTVWAKENPVVPIIWLAVRIVLVGLLAARAKPILELCTRQKWILVLLGWVLASAAWSNVPAITLKRGLSLVLSTLFGVYLAERFTLRQQMKCLFVVLGAVACLSLAAGLFFPQVAIMNGPDTAACWRGIFYHKNELGRLMVLTVIVSLLIDIPRPLKYALMSLAILLLGLSRSASSMVVLLLLGIAFPFLNLLRLNTRRLVQVGTGLSIVLAVVGAWVVSNATDIIYFMLDALGKNATLSGRGALWIVSLEYVSRKPWLGYGYDAFWLGSSGQYSSQIWKLLRWEVPHAHNAFIDLCLNIGSIGLCIFLLAYLLSLWKSISLFRERRDSESLWIVVLFLFTIVANLTESALLVDNNIFWFIFVALAYSLHSKRLEMCAHERVRGGLSVTPYPAGTR